MGQQEGNEQGNSKGMMVIDKKRRQQMKARDMIESIAKV